MSAMLDLLVERRTMSVAVVFDELPLPRAMHYLDICGGSCISAGRSIRVCLCSQCNIWDFFVGSSVDGSGDGGRFWHWS